jgi:hypothetical protein
VGIRHFLLKDGKLKESLVQLLHKIGRPGG